ncbi:amino acid deaminase/aldolase, partial [Cryobacterium sp. 10I1]|nr:amino acid deaminase/aldolase [Cryobacterium sp. 10I1]
VELVIRLGYRLLSGCRLGWMRPAGRRPRALTTGIVNRWVRRHSIAELGVRRAAAVAAVREVAPLEFVNGGGTGSLE